MLAATRPGLSNNAVPSIDNETPSLPYPDALAPAFSHQLRLTPDLYTDLDDKRETSCQKLLFSATLTRDPAKIAALNLRDPKYFVVQSQLGEVPSAGQGVLDLVMEKFTMPATLAVRSRLRP